jgi:hypothetical protein
MRFTARTLLLAILIVSFGGTKGQCTYSCDAYNVSPIPHSMYPAYGDTLVMNDDEVTTNMPIGFNFDFYCNTYNQLRICSNGFITFDYGFISNSGTPYAQNLPSTVTPNGVIAWNWNDLDPSQGGTITYTTTGISPNQLFIVTYSNVPLWTPQNPPSNLRNTGQIVLHESTHLIEIHIKEANNNGWLYHTEGIEDPTATKGVSIPGRNWAIWTASLSSHLFSPYDTGPSPQISGDTVMCQGSLASFVTTTLNNSSGYQWSFPPGWSAPNTQQTTITAMSGPAGVVSVAAIYTCGNSPSATLAIHVIPSPTVSLTASGPSVICSGSAFTVIPAGASFYTMDPGNLTSPSSFVTIPLASTVYTITGLSYSTGCISHNFITASVSVKPSPTIAVNSGTICKGASFSLTPTGATQYTYSSFFPLVTPPSPGIYTYSVWTTAPNGCMSEAAISIVSVAPLPVITISPSNSVICVHETTTLLAQGAQTYTWTGLAGNSHTVVVSPTFGMIFTVVGTDHNGCVSFASASVAVEQCVDINENAFSVLEVFPNPASGKINVRSGEGASFVIHDELGRLLSAGKIQEGVDVIELPVTGMIYVTITNGQKPRRFIIVSQ